jgi:hypothetical protein
MNETSAAALNGLERPAIDSKPARVIGFAGEASCYFS